MIAQITGIETECRRGSGRREQVIHLATLVHRSTGEEASFVVASATDSFSDVWRAVQAERSERRLWGFELFDAVPVTLPF